MNERPSVLLWLDRADDYRAALVDRLPEVRLETRGPDSAAGTARGFSVLLTWKPPVGALQSLPDLAWVQVAGAGVDHILDRPDLPAGVLLTRSLGRFGDQVAEYVVGHLLCQLLDIEGYRERQLEGVWDRRPRPLLADRTVGIVGMGSLGRTIAARVAAFGATVFGVRRSAAAVPGVEKVYAPEEWHRMLPRCDVLVLAVPRTPATVGMVDAEALARLPAGAVLINVARGELLDEEAVSEALDSGKLGAAVLDVFNREPLPPDDPLWQQPGVRITPHVAAPNEMGPIVEEFATNYRRFIADRPLLNLVDKDRGY